jgi:hypothetical protein
MALSLPKRFTSFFAREEIEMQKGCKLILFLVFLSGVAAVCAETLPVKPSNTLYLGFLDDAREEMVNWTPGVARQRVVRPAFERTPTGWKKVDPSSLPPRIKWTIAFHGRNLGQVVSQAGLGKGLTVLQRILTPAAAVPSVGSPSGQFAGLKAISSKVRRPLIAVSKPYFQDPDGWKRTNLSAETAALVRKAFRREFPHVDRCENEKVVQRNWKFPESALALPIAYASNKHSFLVEATLGAGNCGFINDPNDPLSGPWFFVASGGAVRRIGSFMSFLDSGDYDNDGRSELVFFLSQPEDTDGFVLYDATFGKPVTFTWTYH